MQRRLRGIRLDKNHPEYQQARRALTLLFMLWVGFVCGLVAIGIAHAQDTPQPAFSHENCQYPDRWSNPANGCDNSDPAVPECIKEFSTEQGEKDCIARFQKGKGPDVLPEPSDPNRPYYDAEGNKYSWDGKLIEPAPKTLPAVGAKGSTCSK